MTKLKIPRWGVNFVFLFAIFLSACAPAATLVAPSPVVQMVEETRVVTRVVTSEITQVEEVVITNTPTSTPAWTATPDFSPTPSKSPTVTAPWSPPRVEVVGAPGTESTAGWYGPGKAYLYKYGVHNGVWMRVIGRNEDGSWLLIKAGDDLDSNAIWVQTNLVKFLEGTLADAPVFWLGLPYSVLYGPPKAFSTNRVGNKVTVFWQPMWMPEDDYRGYLVEAWVCQGGKQVFEPVGYVTSYLDNEKLIRSKGIIAVEITDEPGCSQPSRARLYAVEKHGYTNYVMLPWPAATP